MPKAPTTPQKQTAGQAPPVSDNANNKSSSKAKTRKPPASRSQNQAQKNSSKRKHHLDSSVTNDCKQAIDLTGDHSDTPGPSKVSSTTRPKQTAVKKPGSRQAQKSTLPTSLPIRTSASPKSNEMTADKPSNSSSQQMSPSRRPAKRARCEDEAENDAVTNTVSAGVEQYHLASPNCSAASLGSVTAVHNPFGVAQQLFSNAAFHAGRSGPDLESNSSKAWTKGDGLFSSAESLSAEFTDCAGLGQCDTAPVDTRIQTAVPTPDNETKIDTDVTHSHPSSLPHLSTKKCDAQLAANLAKPKEEMKFEKDSAQPHPPCTPNLIKKVHLAHELSSALGIPHGEAYRLLMMHNWVGDDAVLKWMDTKADNAKVENGKKDTGC